MVLTRYKKILKGEAVRPIRNKFTVTGLIIILTLFAYGCRKNTIIPDEPVDPVEKPRLPISPGWDYVKGDIYLRTDSIAPQGKGMNLFSVSAENIPSLTSKGTGLTGSLILNCLATTGNTNRYIYFNIDRNILGPMPPGYGTLETDGYNLDVVVEYFDSGTDIFTMQYDGLDNSVMQVGFWPESKYCKKTNTNSWKRFVFHIIRANLNDGLNGADIRIDNNGDGDEFIASISVLKPKLYINPTIYTSAGFNYGIMYNLGNKGWTNLAEAKLGYRLFLNWKSIQPGNRNTFNWSDWDRIINIAIVGNGMKCVPTFPFNTTWSSGSTDIKYGISTDSNRVDYANWVYEGVKRSKDKIKIWETWHEPMWPGMWHSATSANYARLQCAAYQRAKEADPTCCVISGGLVCILNSSSQNYDAITIVNEFFTNGLAWGINAFGYHPVGFEGTTPENIFTSRWEKIYNEIKKYPRVPLWQSEDYILCTSTDLTKRSKFTVRAMAIQRAKMGTLAYSIFPSADFLSKEDFCYGLIDDPNLDKRQPFYNTVKTMAINMMNTLFDSDLKTTGKSNADYCFQFKRYPVDNTGAMIPGSTPVKTVVVLWNTGNSRDVYINGITAASVMISDMDGNNQQSLTVSSGRVNVSSLGDAPKYVVF